MDDSPPIEKPVVYIFHGDDPYAIRQHTEKLLRRMGNPALADLNTTWFDGRQASDDALFTAANSLPFLAERRVVILEYPFSRLQSDAARKRFLNLLDGLPESTAFLLLVPDELVRKGKVWDWKSFPDVDNQWMRKWIKGAGKRAYYQLCQLPKLNEMREWVIKEARRQGGQFTVEAAKALVSHVATDTLLASLEIDKLLTFVDFKRPVEVEDVEDLTAQGGQADIFEMVDALATGNACRAMDQLHRLFETQDPLSLFGMVVRQFRLLIQAREVLDEGRAERMETELHQPRFVADKLALQARSFHMSQLVEIYHRLLAIDEAMKTSQAPPDLALDTFIAELAR